MDHGAGSCLHGALLCFTERAGVWPITRAEQPSPMGNCQRADAFERSQDSLVCPGCDRLVMGTREEPALPYAGDASSIRQKGFNQLHSALHLLSVSNIFKRLHGFLEAEVSSRPRTSVKMQKHPKPAAGPSSEQQGEQRSWAQAQGANAWGKQHRA